MSAPSMTKFIAKRPWLKRWIVPLANWYADAAGYRKLGLRYEAISVLAYRCMSFVAPPFGGWTVSLAGQSIIQANTIEPAPTT